MNKVAIIMFVLLALPVSVGPVAQILAFCSMILIFKKGRKLKI